MFGSGLEELKQFITSAYFCIGALITVCFLTFLFFHYRVLGVKKKLLSVRTLKNSEMLGIEEMQQKMLHLSELQKNVKWGNYNFLIRYRNRVLYDSFNEIRAKLSEVKKEVISLIPASRWLVDNFQMIYRELEKVSDTRIGDRPLPLLQEGEFRGYPRIYVVAREMLELTGGRLSEENILTLLKSYQKGTMLAAAELWALPEMLSHSLLENIIVVAEDILWVTSIKTQADVFVKESFLQNPDNPSIDMLLKKLEIKEAAKVYFHSQVVFLLKNMSFDEVSIQKYLEYHCTHNCKLLRPSNLFQQEGKFESCLEAKIRELLISLRGIHEIDGEELFEQLSILEAILRQDPAGVYAKMDVESRGNYRAVIEKLIVKRNLDEGMAARTCLELARINSSNLRCANHVGTYLVGPGYNIFKAKVLNRNIPKNKKYKQNVKGTAYFCLVAAIFTLLICFLSYITHRVQILGGSYSYALFFFSVAFLLFGGAIDLSNRIFAKLVTVGALPAMDFQSTIPNSARTFVVMPIIVFTKEQAAESIARLLKQYLGNQQENLYFALLVDFADAEAMHLPSDKTIEEELTSGINKINALYPSDYRRFSLFIRERKWNAAENCYMGWERKRGKLEEFNSLLSGDKGTSYVIKLCDERIINTFKYVITLDSDSDLLKNMAAKLVGIIHHPLNSPEIDSDRSKVSAGYGIIQPAVSNHIYKGSLFSQVFSGKQGLDPYARSIFDIYQDVFGEGIFVGKGIYVISAFHNILHQKFPENRVLSHDLLESCFVKTAFSCQARIMEDYPKNLLSYAKREHRWIRGDWQLLPWLFKHSQLSKLSRWKILGNILSSLTPLFKLFVIILSLALLPKFYYVGLIIALFPDVFNLLFLIFETIIYKLRSPKTTLVYKDFFREIKIRCQRSFFELLFMPYMVFVISDAILRTVYRLCISKQHLLNWNTSAITEKQTNKTKEAYYRSMHISVIMAVGIIVVLLLFVKQSIAKTFIFITLAILWGSSYLWAYNIGQEKERSTQEVLGSDEKELRKIARKTWQFFKDYATSDNNWLCPDNYQKEPKEKVTDKTSPTNIGLQMLAVVSARDLGFETLSATVCTIEKMLDSIARLPKWRGHLFNWYNIKTFEVLGPQYISTVDSGNFLGHLLTVKNGLKASVVKPLFSKTQIDGLRELGELCQEKLELQDSYATVEEFAATIKNAQKILEKKQVNSTSQDIFAGELLKSMDALQEELDILNLKGYSCTNCPTLKERAETGNKYAQNLAKKIAEITKTIDKIVAEADFRFLYNKKRALFHIGYHVSSKSLDEGCYDLIASECLLTSVLNIAQNTVPLKHWSKLGRPLTLIKGSPCFVSWSGTMFEYRMPSLVLQEYEGSVFSETARAVVAENIAFAKKRMLPCWGISESQYYQFDQDGNYQYRAFGVHSLRLQTSLGNQNLVFAPYATMLALSYADKECIANLKNLAQLGCVGTYGYYEAIDFNGPNPVTTKPFSIVKSFMAHHQGMILVAINNYLNNGIMQKRFHSEPMIQAVASLLEEKRGSYFVNIPKEGYNINFKEIELKHEIPESRYINKVAPEMPVAHFLSNDNYSILVTSDGDGFSKYKDMMLYRWRPNIYDCTGNYIFIKDVKTGSVWSNTYNPTKKNRTNTMLYFLFIRQNSNVEMAI